MLITNDSVKKPRLRRALGLGQLVIYGIILIQPTAPMPVFGVIYTQARGHVVTTILVALIAMLFTAISYGRMARVHPDGGSAFLYVSKELKPGLGYLCGWCLIMDYVLNPLICTIWCGKAAVNVFPMVPYAGWVIFFSLLFTLLNLNGVETSARINTAIAMALGAVILIFLGQAFLFLRSGPVPSMHDLALPFYDPSTFSARRVFHGTSIAVLTYIGFDGISTLADEALSPERNVARAILITCLVTGLLATIEVYVAQLVWPRGMAFPDVDTAYVYVAGRIGGARLFVLINGALLIATMGSGMASQLGAARILLAMGQAGTLPRRFFGAISPSRSIPRNNVLLVGAICLAGGLLMTYELGAELLNFGALLAFMGVNLAAARHATRLPANQGRGAMLCSLAGFIICLFLWLNLSLLAKVAGSLWALAGMMYWWITRRGIHRESNA